MKVYTHEALAAVRMEEAADRTLSAAILLPLLLSLVRTSVSAWFTVAPNQRLGLDPSH